MLKRLLRRTRRLGATLLSALNYPRPPSRPAVFPNNDWTHLQEYLRWHIRRGLNKTGTPALSIALVDDRQIIWAEGFGYADRERRTAATPETVYQIGSITKLLTAVAVMQLVQQKRLDLDRPVTDYLPEFSMRTRWPQAAPISLRALLCHHAGLPTYLLKGFFSEQTITELLEELRTEHLAYEPHCVFNYSNLGYNLLGLVIERITGLPYNTAMTQQLLTPLGMMRTGFTIQDEIKALLARGYVHDQPVEPTPVRDVPAGGLYSNVLDLARFMRCVLAGGNLNGSQILSEHELHQMFEAQYAGRSLDFGQRFGLGWMLSGLPIDGGGPQAWHNGGTKAFISQLALLPEKKLGVVVLANADCSANLVYEIAETALRLALEIRHGIVAGEKKLAPEVVLPRATLAQHVGDYSLMGSLARVSLGKQRLKLHVLQHVLDLVPVSPDRFRVEFNLLGLKSVPIAFPPVEFLQAEGRRFAVLRDRIAIPAEKIPSYDIPDSWRKLTGDYRIRNPDQEYLVELDHCRMLIEDQKLLMDIKISGIENRRVKVVVVPISDNEAYVFGLGRNVGDVAYARKEGNLQLIRYSGYWFELL